MARAQWPLFSGRPVIQVALTLSQSGKKTIRTLLADTGAGAAHSAFALIIEEHDCVLCGGQLAQTVQLSRAYSGRFPRYRLRVEIPQLAFDRHVFVVGVPTPPASLDGIACFPFVNRFTYSNFANAGEFGLET
jgi:hypothetical protein